MGGSLKGNRKSLPEADRSVLFDVIEVKLPSGLDAKLMLLMAF